MASEEFCLTTVDNPWNPFTNSDQWEEFDEEMGYNSYAYLSRVADILEQLGYADDDEVAIAAAEWIVRLNPLIYKKVYKSKDT